MTGYAKIRIYVCGGSYTLESKTRNKQSIRNFNYFSKPLDLYGERVIKTSIDNVEEAITQLKEKFYEAFESYLMQYRKKWNVRNQCLDFKIQIEKASEQSAQWCLDNLTLEELWSVFKYIENED